MSIVTDSTSNDENDNVDGCDGSSSSSSGDSCSSWIEEVVLGEQVARHHYVTVDLGNDDDGDDDEMFMLAAPGEKQLHQRKSDKTRFLQPVLMALAVVSMVLMLTLGISSSNHQLNQKQNRRSLSNLTAHDEYHAQFYEYQNDSYTFEVRREAVTGQIYALINMIDDDNVDDDHLDDVGDEYRVDCYDVTPTILQCNSTELHFKLDVYTYDNANLSLTGFPDILYTDTRGKYVLVADDSDSSESGEEIPVTGGAGSAVSGDPAGSNGGGGVSSIPDWFQQIEDDVEGDESTTFGYGILVGVLVTAVSLLLFMIAISLHRRRQRYIQHKHLLDEIHREGTIRFQDHSSSSSGTPTSKKSVAPGGSKAAGGASSTSRGKTTGTKGGSNHSIASTAAGSEASDGTEMLEFSESHDIHPAELREIDLSR